MDTERLMPHDAEMEAAVLGAMIVDQNCIADVLLILKGSYTLYVPQHKIVFDALKAMYLKREKIDRLTLRAKVQDKIENAAYFLTTLTKNVYNGTHAERHCYLILQHYIRRAVYDHAQDLIFKCSQLGADPLELLNQAQEDLALVVDQIQTRKPKTKSQQITETIKRLEDARSADGITGITTGHSLLNEFTQGWQKSDLILIAARPGMGKTLAALECGLGAAKADIPVGIAEIEMPSWQLYNRAISRTAEIDNYYIRRPRKLSDNDWQRIRKAAGILEALPLFINDTVRTIMELCAWARKMKKEHDLQLLIVDYAQILQSDQYKGNREQEISFISRTLKALAKELDIPIILLAQLSREPEKRADKKPILSDLRESGSLEQDADVVVFLWRPEYYELTPMEGEDYTNLTRWIFAKHRNGETGFIDLKHNLSIYKYLEPGEQFRLPEYNPTINVNAHIEPIRNDDDLPF